MTLELAEEGLSKRGGYKGFVTRYQVGGYNRAANHVPGYMRRFPRRLNDSSLMTFKLADGSALLYICVPDPQGKQAPRLVREDMFDGLPNTEFEKLMIYVAPCNSQQVLQQAIERRMNKGLSDDAVIQPDTAAEVVESAHTMVPNGATVKSTSFFDLKILGVPVKWLALGAGAWFLLK